MEALREGQGREENKNRPQPKHWIQSSSLPNLVALVLIADGQQIQQHFVEVAQRKVDTHHCHGVTGGHLRAEEERRRRKEKGAEGEETRGLVSQDWNCKAAA